MSDVKVKLANLDRTGLISLVQDLYAANKDNQAFLHARFTLAGNALQPYKAVISKWINPADPRKSMYKGESATHCEECGEEIPESRRLAIPCKYCVACQTALEKGSK